MSAQQRDIAPTAELRFVRQLVDMLVFAVPRIGARHIAHIIPILEGFAHAF